MIVIVLPAGPDTSQMGLCCFDVGPASRADDHINACYCYRSYRCMRVTLVSSLHKIAKSLKMRTKFTFRTVAPLKKFLIELN